MHDPYLAIATVHKWLNIYHDLLEWQLISHSVVNAPLASPTIGSFLIVDRQRHQIGVLLTGSNPVRILWQNSLQGNTFPHVTGRQ